MKGSPGPRVAINLTVLLLIIIWTLPTIGLFITSFRDKQSISNSGWWSAFGSGGFTLDNYNKVLFGGDGLGHGVPEYPRGHRCRRS